MTKKIKWFFCLMLCTVLQGYAQEEKGIKFTTGLSWQQIVAKATAENKYIFVDCFATWCGPCKLMDEEVYPKREVGDFYNAHFICVKVQMDTSKNDNEQVKNWYADAHNLLTGFHIRAFPTFLFFSPDGKAVHRAVGAHRDTDFVNLGKKAMDPEKQYYSLLTNYRQGHKDFKKMVYLAKLSSQIGDQKLADSIAGDYKLNYLDKLPEQELCTKGNLDFISDNAGLVNSRDKFFKLFYHSPDKADQVAGSKGLSDFIVNYVVTMEEIIPKVYVNHNPVGTKPDWKAISANPPWDAITATIAKKYNYAFAEKLVLDTKLKFYQFVQNWTEFARWKDDYILKNPPKVGADATALNQDAWTVFQRCKDKNVLIRALVWSELSIKIDPESFRTAQYYDTKANLLYKLGKVDQAIPWENKAIEQDERYVKRTGTKTGFSAGFYANIEKIKKGEPTW